jgi:hypothetical protein
MKELLIVHVNVSKGVRHLQASSSESVDAEAKYVQSDTTMTRRCNQYQEFAMFSPPLHQPHERGSSEA